MISYLKSFNNVQTIEFILSKLNLNNLNSNRAIFNSIISKVFENQPDLIKKHWKTLEYLLEDDLIMCDYGVIVF